MDQSWKSFIFLKIKSNEEKIWSTYVVLKSQHVNWWSYALALSVLHTHKNEIPKFELELDFLKVSDTGSEVRVTNIDNLKLVLFFLYTFFPLLISQTLISQKKKKIT